MAKRRRPRQKDPMEQVLDFGLDLAKLSLAGSVTSQVLGKIKF